MSALPDNSDAGRIERVYAKIAARRAEEMRHGMLPGSHERMTGPECRCGQPWDRWNDRCAAPASSRNEVST